MNRVINFFDPILIKLSRKFSMPFVRLALFVVYFWFGLLKVVGESPANPLVKDLLAKTMPFISFSEFIIMFGIFEMLIGLSFLFPKLVRISVLLIAIHMITTFMPLVLAPEITWHKSFVPTLEGQYIIKNLLIMATAIAIVSHMHLPHEK